MNKKRTHLEVVHDILTVVKSKHGNVKPTHILYKSNLSHQMMGAYLRELTDKYFIIEQKFERGRTYDITSKGSQFLEGYGLIDQFTISFGLNVNVEKN